MSKSTILQRLVWTFSIAVFIVSFSAISGEKEDAIEIKKRTESVRKRCSELVKKGEGRLAQAVPNYKAALDLFVQAHLLMRPWARHWNPWAISWVKISNKRLGVTHYAYGSSLIDSIRSVRVTTDNHETLIKKYEKAEVSLVKAVYHDKKKMDAVRRQLNVLRATKDELDRVWIKRVDAKEIIARRKIQALANRFIAEGNSARNSNPPDYPTAISRFLQAERLLTVGFYEPTKKVTEEQDAFDHDRLRIQRGHVR